MDNYFVKYNTVKYTPTTSETNYKLYSDYSELPFFLNSPETTSPSSEIQITAVPVESSSELSSESVDSNREVTYKGKKVRLNQVVQTIQDNIKRGAPKHYCTRAIGNGLELKTDVHSPSGMKDPNALYNLLKSDGWKDISLDNYTPLIGDVWTYQGANGMHSAMWNGNNWMSYRIEGKDHPYFWDKKDTKTKGHILRGKKGLLVKAQKGLPFAKFKFVKPIDNSQQLLNMLNSPFSDNERFSKYLYGMYADNAMDAYTTNVYNTSLNTLLSKPKLENTWAIPYNTSVQNANKSDTKSSATDTADTTGVFTGKEHFSRLYDIASKTNSDLANLKTFFTRMADIETGHTFKSDSLNASGASGYFQIMPANITHHNRGTTLQDFLKNPLMQIETAYKMYNDFKSYFNAEDLKLAREKGYTINALIGGAWLGGQGAVKKVLRGKGDPKDSNGTTTSLRMKNFNF